MIPKFGVRYLDHLELQLGVIGPLAGAEHLQDASHELFDASEPKGWGNQLDNEPGLNLFYSREWTGAGDFRIAGRDGASDLLLDISPELGFALGNVHILRRRRSQLSTRPLPPGRPWPARCRGQACPDQTISLARKGFSTFLFGSIEGRVVGRNIFLDGNTFQDDGPSVDKEVLVGEARVGMALTYDNIRLAYTHVFRSQEFEGQPNQMFGSVNFSIAF